MFCDFTELYINKASDNSDDAASQPSEHDSLEDGSDGAQSVAASFASSTLLEEDSVSDAASAVDDSDMNVADEADESVADDAIDDTS